MAIGIVSGVEAVLCHAFAGQRRRVDCLRSFLDVFLAVPSTKWRMFALKPNFLLNLATIHFKSSSGHAKTTIAIQGPMAVSH
jgi:hypothetical protein